MKTHSGQYEIYVAHMLAHDQLRTGAGDPIKLNSLWDALAMEMNAYGAGPKKTATEWRHTLRSWKNQTRSKARFIMDHGQGTGGGAACSKTLTDIEERALSIWGLEAVKGLQVGAVGFEAALHNPAVVVDLVVEELQTNNEDAANHCEVSDDAVAGPGRDTPTIQSNQQASKIKKNQQLQMLVNSEATIATAISRLADRIGDMSVQWAKGHEVLLEIVKTQQQMLSILLEKM